MKKRSLALLLAVVMCLAMAAPAFAAEPASGKCGENLTWALDANGTLTISGTGKMQDYMMASSVPWANQRDKITAVAFSDGVTRIGGYAFYNCTALTSVTIPSSVTSIGGFAFGNCTGLTSITIPDSVTSIELHAFFCCKALASVTIPDSVTSIGDYAFASCTSLTSVTIPSSVTSIGNNAFSDCTGLTSVSILNSAASIGGNAFIRTPWIKNQGEFAVVHGVLLAYQGQGGAVTIPGGITSIGDFAFFNCEGLTSVTIPNGVTSIGNSAFASCMSLTSVTIPSSVTSIGSSPFFDTPWLKQQGEFAVVNGILLKYQGQSSAVTIPSSVTSIGRFAFENRSNLTSVTIPSSVTSIGWGAFQGCSGLKDVYYGGTEAQWKAVEIDNTYNANNFLTSATIHYNGSSTTPEPAPSPIDAYQFSTWAKPQLTAAFDAGLVPENVLNKDLTAGVTRAQFAAVAVKLYEAMSGEKVPAVSENPFDDTSDPYVLQAYSLGLVSGNGSGGFSPDGSLTREMAARLLSNVFTKLGGQIPTAGETQFADDGKISSWARDAVSFMSQKGIVNGSNGSFMPGGDMTGEGAVILAVQMLQNLEV